MIVFASEKRKKPYPKPVESSSGKVFTRKPPSKLAIESPVPVIIQPMDEGAYQLPAWPYPLDYPLLQHLLFSFF